MHLVGMLSHTLKTHAEDVCIIWIYNPKQIQWHMVIAVFVELDTLFYKYEALSGIPHKLCPVAQIK